MSNDVWFSFVAEKTVVTITVRGDTPENSAGSLEMPGVSIYNTDCNDFFELECDVDFQGFNSAEITQSGIIPGVRYYIRVDSRLTSGSGSFQLCIQNYNPCLLYTSDAADE